MNKRNLLVALMAVIVILAGIIILISGTKINQSIIPNKQTSALTPTPKVLVQTITLTNSGFSPSNLAINVGTRVAFLNSSGKNATVNSDPYPYNSKWPFLNLGTFTDGSSVSTIFIKTGIFTYHNQLSPDQKGIINVK